MHSMPNLTPNQPIEDLDSLGCYRLMKLFWHKVCIILFGGEGVGDTHITRGHIKGDTHDTSNMCVGIQLSISRGYTIAL